MRVEAADETSILRGLGEEDSVHEVILDLSLAPEKSGLLLHPGRWVQVLGDLRVNLRGAFVIAHIIRDFKSVDPVRYHAAVRLQAESVPLNVAKNTARSHGQTAPTGQETIEQEADIFFDAEAEPTASSDPKAEESSRFDSSADLFD